MRVYISGKQVDEVENTPSEPRSIDLLRNTALSVHNRLIELQKKLKEIDSDKTASIESKYNASKDILDIYLENLIFSMDGYMTIDATTTKKGRPQAGDLIKQLAIQIIQQHQKLRNQTPSAKLLRNSVIKKIENQPDLGKIKVPSERTFGTWLTKIKNGKEIISQEKNPISIFEQTQSQKLSN